MDSDKNKIFYQLIAKKDFVDWVKNPKGAASVFWQKWLQQHPQHTGEFLQAKEFVQRLQFGKHELAEDELEDMLNKVIAAEDGLGKPRSYSSQRPFGQWLKVAAILVFSVMIALIAGEFLDVSMKPVEEEIAWNVSENPRGRKSVLTLPDGTVVHLNYESKLQFPEHFEGDHRQVVLEGEAFFDVTHDPSKPFMVKAGDMETVVLGTSFNVRASKFSHETKVSLVEGKVKVRVPNNPDHFLSPGEQLKYDVRQEQIAIGPFDISRVTAWKEGVIIFEDTAFDEFVDRLSKWYGVDFQIYGSTPKDWKVNGRYKNEKLEDILIGLQFMYDVKYKIEGKNVTLKFD
ncbi:FecR domain-containing protein [Echinicola sediminis]